MTTVRSIPTPQGEARVHTDRSRSPFATLLVGHGAGGGVDAVDLVALAKALPREGISVVRLEQPWRVAGKKIAPAPALLDQALIAVADKLRVRTPLVLGGRSAGARSACRTSKHLGASGVLALSFPLHPPGKPDKSRVDELEAVGVPTLVIQGENDPFGRPEEFPGSTELAVVPGGDHSLKVPKKGLVSQEDALGIVVEATLEWIVREVVGNAVRGAGV
ncbi:MAG TPA: alpha/beta family hydrolase [Nocardioidaceae bacterium]|nr:alpha/beta family hydrolase [Nocardioidaceae bacterium]